MITASSRLLLVIITLVFIIYLYKSYGHFNLTHVKSSIDNNNYLVRNVPDKVHAANTLARIKQHMNTIATQLYNNRNTYDPEFAKYIANSRDIITNVNIRENSNDGDDAEYTSYSKSKGELIVYCIRSRDMTSNNNIHDLNLIMYVVLHEVSHIICPEYGHTDLFKRIFALVTTEAIKIGIYSRIDFKSNPVNYCGMQITESIV